MLCQKEENIMIIDKDKLLEEKDNILNFLLKNKDLYKEDEFKEIFATFYLDILLFNDIIGGNYRVAQILSKFNIFKEKYDPYLTVYNILNKYDFINGNIVEVGCGTYPRLAEIIKDNHKSNNYNLTVYDTCNIFKMNDISIIKEKFTMSTNIDNVDTLVGIYPCDASVDLTLKGIEENKNLVIAYCSCDHSSDKYQHNFLEYWADDFCYYIKKKYGDDVKIMNWRNYPKRRLPILVHKKRISK